MKKIIECLLLAILTFGFTEAVAKEKDFETCLRNRLAAQSSTEAIRITLERMIPDLNSDKGNYGFLMETAQDFLLNPKSIFYSEQQYLQFLSKLLDSDVLTEAERLRVEDKKAMLLKNKIGSKAPDFSFTTADADNRNLYDCLNGEAEILLVFFDPDCDHCNEAFEKLMGNDLISSGIEQGTLIVLAIYSGDNRVAWTRKAAELPETWLIGINEGEIEDEALYEVSTTPIIYLIDSSGNIKDKNIDLDRENWYSVSDSIL